MFSNNNNHHHIHFLLLLNKTVHDNTVRVSSKSTPTKLAKLYTSFITNDISSSPSEYTHHQTSMITITKKTALTYQ